MDNIENFISYLFYIQHNTKVYHWTTKSYARHKASDSFLSELSDLLDTFVEVYMGRYSRPNFQEKRQVKLQEWNDQEALNKLTELKNILEKQLPKLLSKSDSELFNIRDEMLALINKTNYLYTLN